MYLLAKFQLHIPIPWGVTDLQSSNHKTIDLYSTYRGNKLQALTKTIVTCKRIKVLSYNFLHCACHEQGNRLPGKFFSCLSFFTAFKGKIHEEKSIAYDRFNMT